jgi:carbon monoxide dehydrogenase subunit G
VGRLGSAYRRRAEEEETAMEMAGSRLIAADRAVVWAALNDPEVLKACIPGCKEMVPTPEGGFEATVSQKVGPVSATFKGAVTLSDVVEGRSYRISGEGKGGAAGFAKGGADVRLADAEGGTALDYTVEAHVGGKLAQLGSRIIDGFAKKMADQFFDRFQAAVEEPATNEAAPEADATEEDGKKKGWFRRLIG